MVKLENQVVDAHQKHDKKILDVCIKARTLKEKNFSGCRQLEKFWMGVDFFAELMETVKNVDWAKYK